MQPGVNFQKKNINSKHVGVKINVSNLEYRCLRSLICHLKRELKLDYYYYYCVIPCVCTASRARTSIDPAHECLREADVLRSVR